MDTGFKNPADGPLRCPNYTPQEGDMLRDVNFQTILSSEHMDHIHIKPPSSEPFELSPTSHSSILIATTLQSIYFKTPVEELKSALTSDPSWHKALEQESKDSWRHYKNWLTLDDLILFRDWIYIPPLLCPRILFKHHDSPLAGHPGHAKTIKLIAWEYSWPRLSQDVWWYVHSCDLCQRNKVAWHPYGNLNPLEVPNQNWESISMDFITDLSPSHGFDTLLVVVNHLSKQSHFIPMIQSLDAPRLTQLYISSIFKLHGLLSSIVSDQDPLFTSIFWDALTSQLGIQCKLSTAYYYPQTDSQTKWVNQCVEQYLCNFCSYQQDDWVDWLGIAEFHYNNLIHDSTHISPFYANYGFNPSFSFPHLHQSLTTSSHICPQSIPS